MRGPWEEWEPLLRWCLHPHAGADRGKPNARLRHLPPHQRPVGTREAAREGGAVGGEREGVGMWASGCVGCVCGEWTGAGGQWGRSTYSAPRPLTPLPNPLPPPINFHPHPSSTRPTHPHPSYLRQLGAALHDPHGRRGGGRRGRGRRLGGRLFSAAVSLRLRVQVLLQVRTTVLSLI